MNKDILIKVESVSKKFCKSLKQVMAYGAVDIAKEFFGIESKSWDLRNGEFWALNDVSFELKKGESLGIIGANGSGKSTLLKLLNGIYMPDSGRIEVQGRVGALIEVGAGFHPMLTGRENIYINGSILGLSEREIDEKFDEIVDFADIGEFIDVPVKHYSSGMYVRLGFSVALHGKADILLIDEILSVGDLSFQNKSMRRLAEQREKAKGLIFVSHKLDVVQVLCEKTIVINKGKVVFCGDTNEALTHYHKVAREMELKSQAKSGTGTSVSGLGFTSGDINLLAIGILDKAGEKAERIKAGEDIRVFVDFIVHKTIAKPSFTINIINNKREHCIFHRSHDMVDFASIEQGRYRLLSTFKKPALVPGVYSITLSMINRQTIELIVKNTSHDFSFIVEGSNIPRGIVLVESEWNLERVEPL